MRISSDNKRHTSKLSRFIICTIWVGMHLLMPGDVSAESHLTKVKLSVKPLDLGKPPTTEQLMASGQLGGQLYPTHETKDKAKQKKDNLSFGHAIIQEWNKHNYIEAVKLFRKGCAVRSFSTWQSGKVMISERA